MGKLSARAAATLKEPGRHSDGDGLYLNVTANGGRSWIFMWKRGGRRREMGLGPARDVSLAEARTAAAEARKKVRAGIDPIAEKRRPAGLTFGQAADAYVDSVQAGWRNEKHRWQWRETLTSFCAPIRDVPGRNNRDPPRSRRSATHLAVEGRNCFAASWADREGARLRKGAGPKERPESRDLAGSPVGHSA